jgi:ElaB/YqjD/DUF883 family membrane-anchored ribosome-binding protein
MKGGEERTGSEDTEAKLVGRRRTKRTASADPARLLSALEEAGHSIADAATDVRQRVDEHPWRMLGLAAGAGFILGGGLFTALTGRLLLGGLRIGLRVAALPLVREELLGVFESVTDSGRGETERRQQ